MKADARLGSTGIPPHRQRSAPRMVWQRPPGDPRMGRRRQLRNPAGLAGAYREEKGDHCDHLGAPLELMNQQGEVVWARQYTAWGKVWEERTEGARGA